MIQSMVLAAEPEQVILFGSHARGTATDTSDYDIALVFPTSRQVQTGLKSAHRALWPRKFPVDLVGLTHDTWAQGRSSLAREVARNGKILYTSKWNPA